MTCSRVSNSHYDAIAMSYHADKSTSLGIQPKKPQPRHSREGGNPEVVVITKTGFPPSRE